MGKRITGIVLLVVLIIALLVTYIVSRTPSVPSGVQCVAGLAQVVAVALVSGGGGIVTVVLDAESVAGQVCLDAAQELIYHLSGQADAPQLKVSESSQTFAHPFTDIRPLVVSNCNTPSSAPALTRNLWIEESTPTFLQVGQHAPFLSRPPDDALDNESILARALIDQYPIAIGQPISTYVNVSVTVRLGMKAEIAVHGGTVTETTRTARLVQENEEIIPRTFWTIPTALTFPADAATVTYDRC
jgi:hypothetical protein